MTRRQVLQQALCVPLTASFYSSSGLRILAAPDCLSQESAAGFRSVLTLRCPRNLIVVCGAVDYTSALRLRDHALHGGRILWELSPHAPQPRLFQDKFGVTLNEPLAASHDRLFIRYCWPHATLTRSFSPVVPVHCPAGEIVAHYGAVPVAIKRRIGRGGIVFLGSMLGPNLRAEEREARALAAAIFSGTTSAGTSTAA
ncbi:MAG TPA: hypothetical protein VMF91_00325 [Bryobacteraceae bacterium]|nr:hypothetical protein [Bryobacteraceae bacterium]